MYSKEIVLNGTKNTRTLSNLINKDGLSIKDNLLIRSDALNKIDEEDINTLCNVYNLKRIFDFRTDAEVYGKPDVVIDGVKYIHNPILGSDKIGISKKGEKEDFDAFIEILHKNGVESSKNYMLRTYKTLVELDFACCGYSRFLHELLDDVGGASLWHCSAGKDRAGFATILVLYLLDFEFDDIVCDYLATNLFYSENVNRLCNKFGEEYRPILNSLFGVCKDYVDVLINTCDELYGGFDNYIKDVLKFSDEDKLKLKSIYLR